MRNFPEMDLVIAGDGPLRGKLKMLSRGLDNVRFLGLLSSEEIRRLFQGACAVIVPSLFPETFGLVAAEALSLNVPVIARRAGSLPELISTAGGGYLYENEKDLLEILERIGEQNNLSNEFDTCLVSNPPDVWFENRHVERYLEIIAESLKQGER
jgi:glycosyltransferase involved in cell wall biosynthesis